MGVKEREEREGADIANNQKGNKSFQTLSRYGGEREVSRQL